jgi:enamine deaminase RidA (YjgF/YER057c/UK114 family)
MTDTPESRLSALGFTLPVAAAPAANYVPFVVSGWQLHIAGQIPFAADGSLIKGRLGDDFDVAAGAAAAERCAIGLMAQMKAALGDLSMVRRIVKLNVFVASAPGFTDQPEVANGASNLMVKVFGDAGRHARSAVGVAALPRGVAVEIDAIVEISA